MMCRLGSRSLHAAKFGATREGEHGTGLWTTTMSGTEVESGLLAVVRVLTRFVGALVGTT
jgi:hypothetical protein